MFELALDRAKIPAGLAIEIGSATPLPEDHIVRWHAPALASSGDFVVRGGGTTTTTQGWPITLVRSDVLADGQPTMERLHAFFAVDEYGVIVVARGAVGSIDGARDALIALLTDAKVHHSSGVVALAQVWEG